MTKPKPVPHSEKLYPPIKGLEDRLEIFIHKQFDLAFEALENWTITHMIFIPITKQFDLEHIGELEETGQQDAIINILLQLFENVVDRGTIIATFDRYLATVYRLGAESTIPELPGIGLSLDAPDFAFLDVFRGEYMRGVFEKFFGDIGSQLRTTVLESLAQGHGWQQIIRDVKKVHNFSHTRATTIVRTELARATTRARLMQYQKEESVKYVQLCASTVPHHCSASPKCAERHGWIYTKANATNLIPLHPRCRCTWRPITDMMIRYGMVEIGEIH